MPTVPTYSQPNRQNPVLGHFDARTLAAYEKWTVGHDWDVFGTLNFIPNRKPHIDTAQKHWSRFWQKVDQLTYGQTAVRSGARVERIVCTQFGKMKDNPHLHFVAKSPIEDIDVFCACLNALWAATATVAAPPKSNEIYPIFSVKRTGGYLFHEYKQIDSQTFNDRFTYLNTKEIILKPRADTIDRLKSAASTKLLTAAQAALPTHIENAKARHVVKAKAQGRFNKRNGLNKKRHAH